MEESEKISSEDFVRAVQMLDGVAEPGGAVWRMLIHPEVWANMRATFIEIIDDWNSWYRIIMYLRGWRQSDIDDLHVALVRGWGQ